MKFIGLMSGTSLDGVDAALLEIEGDDSASFSAALLAFVSRRYSAAQRRGIEKTIEEGGVGEVCRLDARFGRWWGGVVREACEVAGVAPEEVEAIGSHGQTVWHEPPRRAAGERGHSPEAGPGDPAGLQGSSLQIGNPAVLAEETGIAVVSDFRSADLAAGGEGAPLVPFADRLLYSHAKRSRAIQNLGGMGNVTLLPPKGSGEPLLAFDTGPGVALIDAAAEMATGGRLHYDVDGKLAERGAVDEGLLSDLMGHPFFQTPPPRSTGRELFGRELVRKLAERSRIEGENDWCDLVATLTALTARSIGEAYRAWVVPRGVDELYLTGGGAHNPLLVHAISSELAPLPIGENDQLGFDPDAREAMAFAILAWARLHGIAGNVPEATGARGPRLLGSLTPSRGGTAR